MIALDSLLLQLSEGRLNHYLNIYSEFDAGGELDLNRIAREWHIARSTFCFVSPTCLYCINRLISRLILLSSTHVPF